MNAQKRLAEEAGRLAIERLARTEPGFRSAVMIDWRVLNDIVEPLIRMETELGTWEMWVSDGEAIEHLQWLEV